MNSRRNRDLRILTCSIVAVVCASALTVAAQDFSMHEGMVLDEKIVSPIGELNTFQERPSSWFGNIFNEPGGVIMPGVQYRVIDTKRIGTLSGPDVWVELQPLEGEVASPPECVAGCWAYLGKSASAVELFSDDDLVGPSYGYGNFEFFGRQDRNS